MSLESVLLFALDVVKGPYLHSYAPVNPFALAGGSGATAHANSPGSHRGGMEPTLSLGGEEVESDAHSSGQERPPRAVLQSAHTIMNGLNDVFVPRPEFCRRILWLYPAESGRLFLYYPEDIPGEHYQRKTLRYSLCLSFRLDGPHMSVGEELVRQLVQPYAVVLTTVAEELRAAEMKYGYVSHGLRMQGGSSPIGGAAHSRSSGAATGTAPSSSADGYPMAMDSANQCTSPLTIPAAANKWGTFPPITTPDSASNLSTCPSSMATDGKSEGLSRRPPHPHHPTTANANTPNSMGFVVDVSSQPTPYSALSAKPFTSSSGAESSRLPPSRSRLPSLPSISTGARTLNCFVTSAVVEHRWCPLEQLVADLFRCLSDAGHTTTSTPADGEDGASRWRTDSPARSAPQPADSGSTGIHLSDRISLHVQRMVPLQPTKPICLDAVPVPIVSASRVATTYPMMDLAVQHVFRLVDGQRTVADIIFALAVDTEASLRELFVAAVQQSRDGAGSAHGGGSGVEAVAAEATGRTPNSDGEWAASPYHGNLAAHLPRTGSSPSKPLAAPIARKGPAQGVFRPRSPPTPLTNGGTHMTIGVPTASAAAHPRWPDASGLFSGSSVGTFDDFSCSDGTAGRPAAPPPRTTLVNVQVLSLPQVPKEGEEKPAVAEWMRAGCAGGKSLPINLQQHADHSAVTLELPAGWQALSCVVSEALQHLDACGMLRLLQQWDVNTAYRTTKAFDAVVSNADHPSREQLGSYMLAVAARLRRSRRQLPTIRSIAQQLHMAEGSGRGTGWMSSGSGAPNSSSGGGFHPSSLPLGEQSPSDSHHGTRHLSPLARSWAGAPTQRRGSGQPSTASIHLSHNLDAVVASGPLLQHSLSWDPQTQKYLLVLSTPVVEVPEKRTRRASSPLGDAVDAAVAGAAAAPPAAQALTPADDWEESSSTATLSSLSLASVSSMEEEGEEEEEEGNADTQAPADITSASASERLGRCHTAPPWESMSGSPPVEDRGVRRSHVGGSGASQSLHSGSSPRVASVSDPTIPTASAAVVDEVSHSTTSGGLADCTTQTTTYSPFMPSQLANRAHERQEADAAELESAASAAICALAKFTNSTIAAMRSEMRWSVFGSCFNGWSLECCRALVKLALVNGWIEELVPLID